MKRILRYFLYVTVGITGATVLVIEVTAVRILSPHFGSSLYVLSSVLTVILGALSVGYYVGGRISDRLPMHRYLFAIIALSGVMVLVSEYISLISLSSSFGQTFSPIFGPLLFGMGLFFVPSFLLGIVSPYIIKLQSISVSQNEIGEVVGITFFWGTFGSILGSLLTGFVFVPFLGINTTIVSTGIVLVGLGILGMYTVHAFLRNSETHNFSVLSQKQTYFVLSVLLVTTLLFALIRLHINGSPKSQTIIYQAEGLYSQLTVNEIKSQKSTIRLLKQDTNHSSATTMDSYDLTAGYAQFAEFYPLLKPDTKDFFMIGAGSYSIPRTLVARNPDIQVTVSEIEPSLLELAQTYFDVQDISRIHTDFVDARVFLAESTTTYDVIFGDAFITDHSVPAHLVTYEFFDEVKRSLTPEGVFMLNFIGKLDGEAPTLTGSLLKTITGIFPNTKVYAFNKKSPSQLQNLMVVSRSGSKPIDLGESEIIMSYGRRTLVKDMEIPTSQFDAENEYVLTDNRSPVEYLILK